MSWSWRRSGRTPFATGPVCFEETVVFRRQSPDGLSRERLHARGVRLHAVQGQGVLRRGGRAAESRERQPPALRVTLLFRRGARAFKDEPAGSICSDVEDSIFHGLYRLKKEKTKEIKKK